MYTERKKNVGCSQIRSDGFEKRFIYLAERELTTS